MTTSADPATRIQELAAAITAHRAAYYDGTPKVSDFEYDQLEDELRTLLAEHPDLAPDPNPLEVRSARRPCCTRRSATSGRCSRSRRPRRPSRSRRSWRASRASGSS